MSCWIQRQNIKDSYIAIQNNQKCNFKKYQVQRATKNSRKKSDSWCITYLYNAKIIKFNWNEFLKDKIESHIIFLNRKLQYQNDVNQFSPTWLKDSMQYYSKSHHHFSETQKLILKPIWKSTAMTFPEEKGWGIYHTWYWLATNYNN